MSIIKKIKNTEEYKKKLENAPTSTRRNKLDAVKKFQKFCKEKHNSTAEEICKELVILKKQNEEEYIDALYDILQEWIMNTINAPLDSNGDSSSKINDGDLEIIFEYNGKGFEHYMFSVSERIPYQ